MPIRRQEKPLSRDRGRVRESGEMKEKVDRKVKSGEIYRCMTFCS